MKRKRAPHGHGSREEQDENDPPPARRLRDELVADEILSRLPASAAARCATLSRAFRGLLASSSFWLRHHRLGGGSPARAPAGPPRFACFARFSDADARLHHAFHFVSPGLSVKHAVASCRSTASVPGGGGGVYRCAGTCNGLVLLSETWSHGRRVKGVLVNPATKEEETVLVTLPDDGGKDALRCFCGFAYSSSRAGYIALVCERGGIAHSAGKLMVVPFGGGREGQQQVVRTVFSSCRWTGFPSCLSLDGEVVYILATGSTVLALDVGDETVTAVALPPGGRQWSPLMEIWGRPCVATWDGKATTLWALTGTAEDRRWERRCTLAEVPDLRTDTSWDWENALHGAWDCQGVLFTLFARSGVRVYDLEKAAEEEGGVVLVHRPAASSWKNIRVRQPEEAKHLKLQVGRFLWGYQPTLVSPSGIFGDGARSADGCSVSHFRSGRCRRPGNAVAAKRLYLEAYVELTRNLPEVKVELIARLNNA